jgi:hypothetical protein
MDGWCCLVEWDQVCAEEARLLCTASCPADSVTWIDPPDGVIDARQPHSPNDAEALQGIETFLVAGPGGGADACCWELCETDFGGHAPNAILDVEDNGDETYTIRLERPITASAVTTLTYRGGDRTGTFVAHPGNVDGDANAAPSDILALIDCLNGLEDSCPWAVYSCDIDHDGVCAPADILRLIDLLNGAGAFESWNGTALPEAQDICP